MSRRTWIFAAFAALTSAACSDLTSVDWNRVEGPAAGVGGAASVGGAAGSGGEMPQGGETNGGGNGGSTGGTPAGGKGGDGGKGGAGGGTGGDNGSGGASGGSAGTASLCGNNELDEGEECDDGNTVSGDGCSSVCTNKCEICERDVCSQYYTESAATIDPNACGTFYDACYNMVGNAEGGPAAGVPRKELCRKLVDCVHETQCGSPVVVGFVDPFPVILEGFTAFYSCWCASQPEPGEMRTTAQLCQDPATFVPGPCQREFEEASEGDSAIDVDSYLTAHARPLGIGNLQLRDCDSFYCRHECLPGIYGQGGTGVVEGALPCNP